MAKYRKKPVIIEAVQLRTDTYAEICKFITLPWGENDVHGLVSDKGILTDDQSERISLSIPTLEGDHIANRNDFIIKGVKGEFYPCKPDIFEQTYEKIDN